MIRILRFGCLLALAQVIFGVILFFIELWTMNVSNFEIARSITLTSVIYFSFTLLEMSITNALKDKDSSYFNWSKSRFFSAAHDTNDCDSFYMQAE